MGFKKSAVKILAGLLCLAALLAGISSPAPADSLPPWQAKVDTWVSQTAAEGETEFILFLSEQADLSGAAALGTKQAKGAYVYQQLVETARQTQGALVTELEALGAPYRPYWIANMIWVRGDAQLVQRLAERSDVARLYANPAVRLDEPTESAAPALETPETVEWNLTQVNADDAWAMGFRGQGVVIAGQDTGYDWDHPALIRQYRGWNGSSADHNYNWHDAIHANNPITPAGNPCGFNLTVPCDDDDHGTHTMGTMVGDDGAANQVGMAPGARWIGCRNMEEGWGTPASYSECFEWFIAPTDLNGADPRPDLAPDVINNSWACPSAEGCTDPNMLKTVVENVRAAGILVVVSAGNNGINGCGTVDMPPGIYDAAYSVGATNSLDAIANFSSRGSVSVDGSNRLKPDVSAPGVNIRSSTPGTGYEYKNGTSMAAPHVAGLAALLISADPALAGQVDDLEAIIAQTALPRTTSQNCGGVPGTNIPNNTYGWGRIDALAALRRALNFVYLPVAASGADFTP